MKNILQIFRNKRRRRLNTGSISKRYKKKKKNKKKELREKEVRRRKNFFPALLITTVLWVAVGYIIFFVDPEQKWALQLFLFFLFLSTLFTFSLLFANKRRGFISSLVVIIFFALSYFGAGNVLNLALLTGIGVAAEIYFTKN